MKTRRLVRKAFNLCTGVPHCSICYRRKEEEELNVHVENSEHPVDATITNPICGYCQQKEKQGTLKKAERQTAKREIDVRLANINPFFFHLGDAPSEFRKEQNRIKEEALVC